jgi:hypothetical protein
VKETEIDTMNTSSIDLICCALGGLLMLMLFIATLVRASSARGDAPDPADDGKEKENQKLNDEGFAVAPPQPLVVTVRWSGELKYPLTLTAYPPANTGTRPVPQDEKARKGLTEQKGDLVVARTSYFGFFTRKSKSAKEGNLKLVVPGGSRAGGADAASGAQKKSPSPGHLEAWRFVVAYPNAAPKVRGEKADDFLKRLFATPFKLVARTADVANPADPSPLDESSKASKEMDLKPFAEKGAITLGRLHEALGGTPLRPKVPVARVPLAASGESHVGFVVAPPDHPKYDALLELWLEAVLPAQAKAARLPPTATFEDRNTLALRVVRDVDDVMKKYNLELSFESVVPGTGAWLQNLRDYAAAMVGTVPDTQAKSVKVWVTAVAHPEPAKPLVRVGTPQIELALGATAEFSLPPPKP